MKRILILGSTGSIGTQALEVIDESPDLQAVGVAALKHHALLARQASDSGITQVAIADEGAAPRLESALPAAHVFAGPGGISRLIQATDCDLVLNAVVGAAGLEATIAAIEKGVDLALANKESLVVGGDLVKRLAAERGVSILPVDSEHSAIFQCLKGARPRELEHIFLTASGGPFHGKSINVLEGVTREDALDHPRWEMGSKITIDSATLMNKGLEIIEAHYLFDTPYADIEVLIHPQSIVHSLVRFRDGSILGQLGVPSMKLPIAYALNYPERKQVAVPALDLAAEEPLTFTRPDNEAFPCLGLAKKAGERGGGAPVVLNAANEVAVAAFLDGEIGFMAIPQIVADTMAALDDRIPDAIDALETIIELDGTSRKLARNMAV